MNLNFNFSNLLTVTGTAISSFFIASCIVVKYVWLPWMNQIEDEHEKEDLEYEYLHMQEYDVVDTEKPIDDNKLEELKNSYVEEITPTGKVTMFYNKDAESFWYYSDIKDISYKYLDTIARIYCLKFNCKSLYINTFHEYKKGIEQSKQMKKEDERKMEEEIKEKEKKEKENNKSVFANFKHYNKGKGGEVKTKKNKYGIMMEFSNRYTYKGKLELFDEYQREIKPVNENSDENSDENSVRKELTFEEFKRLQLEESLDKKNQ